MRFAKLHEQRADEMLKTEQYYRQRERTLERKRTSPKAIEASVSHRKPRSGVPQSFVLDDENKCFSGVPCISWRVPTSSRYHGVCVSTLVISYP